MAFPSFNSHSIACTFLLSCSFGMAFQPDSEYPVMIATRAAAKPATELLPAHLRVDTSLVLVPVHVTTTLGISVTDLS
jgi:short-subunit dehydrogenase involved in D-alanine esterification of teichoic acids